MKRLGIFLFALSMFTALPAAAQESDTQETATTNMEILRDKLRADKKLVVAENMTLTDTEAKAFWPLYDAYQKELQAINERLENLIVSYAGAYTKGAVADSTAQSLLNDMLDIEDAEVKLKRSYAAKLGKAIPATKVARYLQIETKIRALIKYELAAEIPLVE